MALFTLLSKKKKKTCCRSLNIHLSMSHRVLLGHSEPRGCWGLSQLSEDEGQATPFSSSRGHRVETNNHAHSCNKVLVVVGGGRRHKKGFWVGIG